MCATRAYQPSGDANSQNSLSVPITILTGKHAAGRVLSRTSCPRDKTQVGGKPFSGVTLAARESIHLYWSDYRRS